MDCATSSPARRPARVRAMSMPEDTPAAVTYFPSVTTRSLAGLAPRLPSSSMASQWVVARRPFSSTPSLARPVGVGGPPVQYPPPGQEERAGADRGGPGGFLVDGAEPLVQRAV